MLGTCILFLSTYRCLLLNGISLCHVIIILFPIDYRVSPSIVLYYIASTARKSYTNTPHSHLAHNNTILTFSYFAANNLLRPLRFSLSLVITPFFNRIIEFIQKKTGYKKAVATGVVIFMVRVNLWHAARCMDDRLSCPKKDGILG